MLGHDPARTGYNPYETQLSPPLRLKWSYQTAGATSPSYQSAGTGSPAVASGVVYLAGYPKKVYALDAASGALKWSYALADGYSSPAVSNGVVYVGSPDGKVYALDAASGALKWSYTTGDRVDSSPAVADGAVYVGSYDKKLHALDAASGALKWSYDTGGATVSSPAVASGVVYAASWGGKVYALDAASGALKWSYAPADGYSSPAVSNGVVYVGSGNGKKVYALDAASGALKWSYDTGGATVSSPAVASGVVYVGSTDGKVYALDAASGALKWSYQTGGTTTGVVWSSPAVASGVVYVGSLDWKVYALDAASGALKWSYATDGQVSFSPAVASGVLYVGSSHGTVYAFVSESPPTAVIDSISPSAAVYGQPVSFTGHGADPDAGDTIVGYNWRSSLDGQLSTSASFTASNLSAGSHTIYFKVQDSWGVWSQEVSQALVVNPRANSPPIAAIDSVVPYRPGRGQAVYFRGHGTDPDVGDTIVGYNWRSSLDGQLSTSAYFATSRLSGGSHTIYFKVQDSRGAWSQEVSLQLTVVPWIAQTSGTTKALYSVTFVDSQTGWAVGSGGTILKTTNGGATWSPQSSTTTNTLMSVAFADAQTGWAVGTAGTIVKTTNGGQTWTPQTWTPQTSVTSADLYSVHAVDSRTAWAVGGTEIMFLVAPGSPKFESPVLKTNDGGTTWTQQSWGGQGRLACVTFVDAQNGWMVGSFGTIRHTTNAGETWSLQSSPGYSLFSVAFVDAQTGWAVGEGAAILKTTNGGQKWSEQASGVYAGVDLNSVAFVDAQTGWAVGSASLVGGSGTIVKTTDGGQTWTQQQPSDGTSTLNSVAFVDANTGWAVGDGGTILRYLPATGEAPPSGSVRFEPLYPLPDSISSTVGLGGVAHRYYLLRDATSNAPVSGAVVTLDKPTVYPAVSASDGLVDIAIKASDLASIPGDVRVNVTGVEGRTLAGSAPSFLVHLDRVPYSNSWRGGLVRKGTAGVGVGLRAAVKGSVDSGLEMTLEETQAGVASDDQLLLGTDWAGQAGVEAGAGAGVGVKAGIMTGEDKPLVGVSAKAGAGATASFDLMALSGVSARFQQPYSDASKRAQAIYILGALADIALGGPSQAFLFDLIARLASNSSYWQGSIEYREAGLGAHLRQAPLHAGATASLALGPVAVPGVSFDLVDVNANVLLLATFARNERLREFSLALEQEIEGGASLAALEAGPHRDKLTGFVGSRAVKLRDEIFWDSVTRRLKRVEISVTGEGSSGQRLSEDTQEITVKFILDGDLASSDVIYAVNNIANIQRAWDKQSNSGLRVGASAVVEELARLISKAPLVKYEITSREGAATSMVPTLGFETSLGDIEVSLGVELERASELTRQKGALSLSKDYATEVYTATVQAPDKNVQQLINNAVQGAWLLVRDAYTVVKQAVSATTSWVVEVVAKTSQGVQRGFARLIGRPGTGVQTAGIKAMAVSEITAMGWVPMTSATSGTALRAMAAVPDSFVVGGTYQFQPEGTAISPPATLEVSWAGTDVTGKDVSKFAIYQWNAAGNNWSPLPSTVDAPGQKVTAQVSRLGTFAIGYDAVPPAISGITPANGQVVKSTMPTIAAAVADTGSGVLTSTVTLAIDGAAVPVTYNSYTQQMSYTPASPLAIGPHTVRISASDVAGNSASAASSFTLTYPYELALPLVFKSHSAGW